MKKTTPTKPTPLAWEPTQYEHPQHGKLTAEKAKCPGGEFLLYQEPDVRKGTVRLDWKPTSPSRHNPAGSSRGPTSALKRLAESWAAKASEAKAEGKSKKAKAA